MTFTVTALGSASDKPVPVVVGQVARYLSASASPRYALKRSLWQRGVRGRRGEPQLSGPGRHAGTLAGAWFGEVGLTGTVDLDEFTSVLARPGPAHQGTVMTPRILLPEMARLVASSRTTSTGPKRRALHSRNVVAVAERLVAIGNVQGLELEFMGGRRPRQRRHVQQRHSGRWGGNVPRRSPA